MARTQSRRRRSAAAHNNAAAAASSSSSSSQSEEAMALEQLICRLMTEQVERERRVEQEHRELELRRAAAARAQAQAQATIDVTITIDPENGPPLYNGRIGDTVLRNAVALPTMRQPHTGEEDDDDDDYDIVFPGFVGEDGAAYANGGFGAVPASSEAIAGLEETPVGEAREQECAVCLQEFEEGDKLRKMPCLESHCFHEKCIFDWLSASRICPLCRFALPARKETDGVSEGEGV